MREWRKSHPLTKEQKRKASTRRYTSLLVARGTLVKDVCKECGCEEVEAHHEDYNNARQVMWLCRPCHLQLHKEQS